MITLSENLAAALALDCIESFYMVKIVNKASRVLLAITSFYTDFTLSDGQLYRSNAYILSIDPPQLNSSVDREQYKIALNDPSFSFRGEVDAGLVGKIIEVRLGFVDTSTDIPYSDISDTIIAYKGKIDSASYILDTKDLGSNTLEIIGASPMNSLDQTNGIYSSREFIRAWHATDSCCDQITLGTASMIMMWGKDLFISPKKK